MAEPAYNSFVLHVLEPVEEKHVVVFSDCIEIGLAGSGRDFDFPIAGVPAAGDPLLVTIHRRDPTEDEQVSYEYAASGHIQHSRGGRHKEGLVGDGDELHFDCGLTARFSQPLREEEDAVLHLEVCSDDPSSLPPVHSAFLALDWLSVGPTASHLEIETLPEPLIFRNPEGRFVVQPRPGLLIDGDATAGDEPVDVHWGQEIVLGRFRCRVEAPVKLPPGFQYIETISCRDNTQAVISLYRAEQQDPRREVVLKKVMDHPGSQASRAETERRGHEAVMNIRHPNLMKTYEILGGEKGKPLWVAMEFVPGRRLNEVLKRPPGRLGPSVAVDWIRQIGRAVNAMQHANVVHRDVNPNNVIITNPDTRGKKLLKVIDPGMARTISEFETVEGTVVGTPPYMPPEVYKAYKQGSSGVRWKPDSDVYALGAMLYRLLSGEEPSPDGVDEKLLSGGALGWARDVIRRACSREVSTRHENVDDFLDELDATFYASAGQRFRRSSYAASWCLGAVAALLLLCLVVGLMGARSMRGELAVLQALKAEGKLEAVETRAGALLQQVRGSCNPFVKPLEDEIAALRQRQATAAEARSALLARACESYALAERALTAAPLDGHDLQTLEEAAGRLREVDQLLVGEQLSTGDLWLKGNAHGLLSGVQAELARRRRPRGASGESIPPLGTAMAAVRGRLDQVDAEKQAAVDRQKSAEIEAKALEIDLAALQQALEVKSAALKRATANFAALSDRAKKGEGGREVSQTELNKAEALVGNLVVEKDRLEQQRREKEQELSRAKAKSRTQAELARALGDLSTLYHKQSEVFEALDESMAMFKQLTTDWADGMQGDSRLSTGNPFAKDDEAGGGEHTIQVRTTPEGELAIEPPDRAKVEDQPDGSTLITLQAGHKLRARKAPDGLSLESVSGSALVDVMGAKVALPERCVAHLVIGPDSKVRQARADKANPVSFTVDGKEVRPGATVDLAPADEP